MAEERVDRHKRPEAATQWVYRDGFVIKAADPKRPRVRPAIVWQNWDVKPILPDDSPVCERRYRQMLEDIARFARAPFRQQDG